MSRVIQAFAQMLDGAGEPVINGWMLFLESGTNNTKKSTYQDASETIANTNPIQLDAEGRVPSVFGTGTYRVILYTNDPLLNLPGAQLQVFDPVGGAVGVSDFNDWAAGSLYQTEDIAKGTDGSFYKSTASDNINNDPTEVDTEYWEQIAFIRVWSEFVTYATGERVQDPVNGFDYTSAGDGNLGLLPSTHEGVEWINFAVDASVAGVEAAGAAQIVLIEAAGDAELVDIAAAGDAELVDIAAAGDAELVDIAAAGLVFTSAINNIVPSGGIIIWSGAVSALAALAPHWYLCDGNNGTPNLTDRFVIHADADSGGTRNVGATGGANTHGHADTFASASHKLITSEIPSHAHGQTSTITAGGGNVTQKLAAGAVGSETGDNNSTSVTGGDGYHSHALSGAVTDGANIPKYYALAYIRKS